jgi:hypothetical protein
MIIRLLTFLNIAALFLLVYLNFYFKNHFRELSLSEKILSKKIDHEKQLSSNLNAEFSYLTSPKNLQILATKYLDLKNVNSSQIVKDLDQALINNIDKKTK